MLNKNDMIEYLKENLNVLNSFVIQLNDYNECLEELEVFNNDSDFFNKEFKDQPYDLVKILSDSDNYRIEDEYVRFTEYGLLESLDGLDYKKLLLDNAEYILDLAIHHYQDTDIEDDELIEYIANLD